VIFVNKTFEVANLFSHWKCTAAAAYNLSRSTCLFLGEEQARLVYFAASVVNNNHQCDAQKQRNFTLKYTSEPAEY